MENLTIGGNTSGLRRVVHPSRAALLFLMVLVPTILGAQTQQTRPAGADPAPEPAVAAILAAFDKYQVVAMPEAHGMKDVDDFILTLIRNPYFSDKVDDIVVECGNSLYQPILDRYIAGENVEFSEARKAWRNTALEMCDGSGFFEQLFPLIRAINKKIPPTNRLRVLAGEPPIDWDKVKSSGDVSSFMNRDENIALVMEQEVLSKKRKALMLYGTYHLFHGYRMGAVGRYESSHPDVTFVIGDLGVFDTNLPNLTSSPFAKWTVPSLVKTKGTWLGAFELDQYLPPLFRFEGNCNIEKFFPEDLQGRPVEELVDALLYFGPQDLRLREPMPASIALDTEFRAEWQRRALMRGLPGVIRTTEEVNQQIVKRAEDPIFVVPQPDLKAMVQNCLDSKKRSETPQ